MRLATTETVSGSWFIIFAKKVQAQMLSLPGCGGRFILSFLKRALKDWRLGAESIDVNNLQRLEFEFLISQKQLQVLEYWRQLSVEETYVFT